MKKELRTDVDEISVAIYKKILNQEGGFYLHLDPRLKEGQVAIDLSHMFAVIKRAVKNQIK